MWIRKAFTLIELLIVVAIIALLVSILLPSLQRARDEALTVVCMSNLKSINLCLEYYAADWSDAQPITRAWGPDQGGTYIGWVKYLVDGKYAENPYRAIPGGVFNESQAGNSIFFCPDKSKLLPGETCHFWPNAVSHYAQTLLAGSADDGDAGVSPWKDLKKFHNYRDGIHGPYKVSEIQSPADTLRVAEGSWRYYDPMNDYRFPDYLWDYYDGSPGVFYMESTYPAIEWRLHVQSSPLGFFDGHVERFNHGSLNDWKGRVPGKWFIQH